MLGLLKSTREPAQGIVAILMSTIMLIIGAAVTAILFEIADLFAGDRIHVGLRPRKRLESETMQAAVGARSGGSAGRNSDRCHPPSTHFRPETPRIDGCERRVVGSGNIRYRARPPKP